VNKKLVDSWSIPHIIIGYLFGRYTELTLPQFTLLNGGWEIFENTVLKKHYDIFNTPFGRETVYESPGNSVMDFLITEAGYIIGSELKNLEDLRKDRTKLYAEAEKYAMENGKKFLVAGTPFFDNRWYHECGDVNVDINWSPCENFIQADIQNLHMFKDKEFGSVFASHVLEHVDDIEKAFQELNRVADKVFVAYPNPKYMSRYFPFDHKWIIYSAPPETDYLEYRRINGR